MARQIPWLRIVAEGTAIVASILLAFGIQAWWEAREDRLAAREYLSAIRDEIDQNLDALAGNERVAERVTDYLRTSERLLASQRHLDEPESFISNVLLGAIPAGPPRVATSVFDDLTSTGRIVVIEDLEVRRAVLDLYAQIDINFERMQRRTDAVDVELYRTLVRHVPPGLIRRDQSSPIQLTFETSALESEDFLSLAERIGSDPAVRAELRAAFVEHEDEKVYRARFRERLLEAKALLDNYLNQPQQ